jgi:hypothetical protein
MSIEDPARPQGIEELRERHKTLETEKIRAQTNFENSRLALDGLRKQARETYGTDNLEELRAMLEDMRAENERKRAEYQQHLEDVERQLATVEQTHAEGGQKEPSV